MKRVDFATNWESPRFELDKRQFPYGRDNCVECGDFATLHDVSSKHDGELHLTLCESCYFEVYPLENENE